MYLRLAPERDPEEVQTGTVYETANRGRSFRAPIGVLRMGAGASVDSSSAAARESVSQLGLSAPTLSALQQLPPGAQEELLLHTPRLLEQQRAVSLAPTEFPGLHTAIRTLILESAKPLFDSIDANGDGTLSFSEIESVLLGEGSLCTQADVRYLFNNFDHDGNESITFCEFKSGLKQFLGIEQEKLTSGGCPGNTMHLQVPTIICPMMHLQVPTMHQCICRCPPSRVLWPRLRRSRRTSSSCIPGRARRCSTR